MHKTNGPSNMKSLQLTNCYELSSLLSHVTHHTNLSGLMNKLVIKQHMDGANLGGDLDKLHISLFFSKVYK